MATSRSPDRPLAVAIFDAYDGRFEGASLAYMKTAREEVVASGHQVQTSPQGAYSHIISSSEVEVSRVRGQVQLLMEMAKDMTETAKLLDVVRGVYADLQAAVSSVSSASAL